MNSRTILVLVAIFILFNAALFLASRNNKLPMGSPQFPTAQNNTPSLPLDINNKSVESVMVLYKFQGKIVKLVDVQNNKEILLDNQDQGVPAFVLNKDTVIVKQKNTGPAENATLKDLVPGTDVEITENYDLKTKNWNTVLVTIPQ